jgi:hypothetical protein
MLQYLKNQPLEILFVDDNCPISGIERGGQSQQEDARCDDFIGKAEVSLVNLVKGTGINGDFPIKGSNGENRGSCAVKITVVDPSKNSELTKGKVMKDIKSTEKNAYSS